MSERVVLAMSGGVDSSVAAHLLKEAGYDVVGLFMRTGAHGDDPERRSKTCCSITDALDARAVADRLDIPFHALDFERDFEKIIDRFTDEYLAGRTPNPCVLCNNWLKFGKLWAFGKQIGASHVATGHYAQIARDGEGRARIARGSDPSKDQSYVLFGIKQAGLNHILFPVGGMQKSKIRELARELGLPVHDKADSQEICFVPDDDHVRMIRSRAGGDRSGEIVDEAGATLGEHAGIEGFTIGQRRGLGIALGEPRYVIQIEPVSRKVTVGPRESLDRIGLEASSFNWHTDPPLGTRECLAQIRAQHRAVPAQVELLDGDPSRIRVRFDRPQQAVAPGQAVVLYAGELVLGGGWIDRSLSAAEADSRGATCQTPGP